MVSLSYCPLKSFLRCFPLSAVAGGGGGGGEGGKGELGAFPIMSGGEINPGERKEGKGWFLAR